MLWEASVADFVVAGYRTDFVGKKAVVVRFVVVVVSDTSIVESEPFSALVFLPSVLQLL